MMKLIYALAPMVVDRILTWALGPPPPRPIDPDYLLGFLKQQEQNAADRAAEQRDLVTEQNRMVRRHSQLLAAQVAATFHASYWSCHEPVCYRPTQENGYAPPVTSPLDSATCVKCGSPRPPLATLLWKQCVVARAILTDMAGAS